MAKDKSSVDQARKVVNEALQDIAKYRLYNNDQTMSLLEADKRKGKLPAWLYWVLKTNESLFGGPKQAVAGFLAAARHRAISAAIKAHPELENEIFTFSDPTGTKQLRATGKELAHDISDAVNATSGAIDTALMATAPTKAIGIAGRLASKQALKEGVKQMAKTPGKSLAKAALPAAYATGAVADIASTPESPDNTFTENKPDESVPYVNPDLDKPKANPIITSAQKLSPSSYLRPVAGGLAGSGAGYMLSSLFTENPWIRGASTVGGGLGGAYLSLDSKDRAAINKSIKDLFTFKH